MSNTLSPVSSSPWPVTPSITPAQVPTGASAAGDLTQGSPLPATTGMANPGDIFTSGPQGTTPAQANPSVLQVPMSPSATPSTAAPVGQDPVINAQPAMPVPTPIVEPPPAPATSKPSSGPSKTVEAAQLAQHGFSRFFTVADGVLKTVSADINGANDILKAVAVPSGLAEAFSSEAGNAVEGLNAVGDTAAAGVVSAAAGPLKTVDLIKAGESAIATAAGPNNKWLGAFAKGQLKYPKISVIFGGVNATMSAGSFIHTMANPDSTTIAKITRGGHLVTSLIGIIPSKIPLAIAMAGDGVMLGLDAAGITKDKPHSA